MGSSHGHYLRWVRGGGKPGYLQFGWFPEVKYEEWSRCGPWDMEPSGQTKIQESGQQSPLLPN